MKESCVGNVDPVAYRIAYRMLCRGNSSHAVARKMMLPLEEVKYLATIQQGKETSHEALKAGTNGSQVKTSDAMRASEYQTSLPFQNVLSVVHIEREQLLL